MLLLAWSSSCATRQKSAYSGLTVFAAAVVAEAKLVFLLALMGDAEVEFVDGGGEVVGVELDGEIVKPHSVRVVEQLANKTWLEFRLGEGKNREIRRVQNAIMVKIHRNPAIAACVGDPIDRHVTLCGACGKRKAGCKAGDGRGCGTHPPKW